MVNAFDFSILPQGTSIVSYFPAFLSTDMHKRKTFSNLNERIWTHVSARDTHCFYSPYGDECLQICRGRSNVSTMTRKIQRFNRAIAEMQCLLPRRLPGTEEVPFSKMLWRKLMRGGRVNPFAQRDWEKGSHLFSWVNLVESKRFINCQQFDRFYGETQGNALPCPLHPDLVAAVVNLV